MPHWLVIDLEATTEEGGWPVEEMEIIEIGASLVAEADGRELDHFQRFVRPQRRPLLTAFCRELTHITQANVDAAAPCMRSGRNSSAGWPSTARAWPAGPAGATTTVTSWNWNGAARTWTAIWPVFLTSTSNSASPRPASSSGRWA